MVKNKRGRPKGRRGTFNYHQAFIDFCTPKEEPPYNYPSYPDIAEKYGVSITTIETYARRYLWVKNREKLGQEKETAFIENNIETAKKEDTQQFRKLAKAEQLITKKIFQYMEEQDTVGLDRRLKSKDIKNIVEALVIVQRAKRVILKLPTDVTKAEVVNRNLNANIGRGKIKEMDTFLKENATD